MSWPSLSAIIKKMAPATLETVDAGLLKHPYHSSYSLFSLLRSARRFRASGVDPAYFLKTSSNRLWEHQIKCDQSYALQDLASHYLVRLLFRYLSIFTFIWIAFNLFELAPLNQELIFTRKNTISYCICCTLQLQKWQYNTESWMKHKSGLQNATQSIFVYCYNSAVWQAPFRMQCRTQKQSVDNQQLYSWTVLTKW